MIINKQSVLNALAKKDQLEFDLACEDPEFKGLVNLINSHLGKFGNTVVPVREVSAETLNLLMRTLARQGWCCSLDLTNLHNPILLCT